MAAHVLVGLVFVAMAWRCGPSRDAKVAALMLPLLAFPLVAPYVMCLLMYWSLVAIGQAQVRVDEDVAVVIGRHGLGWLHFANLGMAVSCAAIIYAVGSYLEGAPINPFRDPLVRSRWSPNFSVKVLFAMLCLFYTYRFTRTVQLLRRTSAVD